MIEEQLKEITKFQRDRKQVCSDTKMQMLESCVRSIMFDLDRLTQSQRETFNKKYGKLFEDAMNQAFLPESDRNLRLLDIDQIQQLRLNLA